MLLTQHLLLEFLFVVKIDEISNFKKWNRTRIDRMIYMLLRELECHACVDEAVVQ
jgi:hypothetical protein